MGVEVLEVYCVIYGRHESESARDEKEDSIDHKEETKAANST